MIKYVILISALTLVGCNAEGYSRVEIVKDNVQATDLKFLCNWDSVDHAFQKVRDDYAQGYRRSADAWTLLLGKKQAGLTPKEQGICWHGALLYLGVFGERSELPKLIQLLTKDPVLELETTDPDQLHGISSFGAHRSVSFQYAGFQALAAQVRRQLIFDGALDSDAETAQVMIQKCALDHTLCMIETEMYPIRRHRLQRSAVRGLAILGTAPELMTLKKIQANVISYHSQMKYAVEDATSLATWLENNISLIKPLIPKP